MDLNIIEQFKFKKSNVMIKNQRLTEQQKIIFYIFIIL